VKDFVPQLLNRGISRDQVQQITVHNPAGAFSFE
jgi:predicted metal-dependent phosphotriesterase family hydrolase